MSRSDRSIDYKFSDEERLELLRKRRLRGIPFNDDPLRDLQIVQGDQSIESVVGDWYEEHQKPIPRTMLEQELLDKKSTIKES